MTTSGFQLRRGLDNLAPGTRIRRNRCGNVTLPSVELTTYKSYSIPAGVLGAFAVSHANVWRCGLKVTPGPGPFPPPSLLARLPYRFPRGRFTHLLRVRV